MEGGRYVPALMKARQSWLELESQSGVRLFHPSGILTVGRPDDDLVRSTETSAEQNGLTLDRLSVHEVGRRYPQLQQLGNAIGLLDPAGGLLEPERAVRAALSVARAAGAELRLNCGVLGIEDGPAGVVVRTGGGEERFDHVIVTAGAWAKELLPEAFPTVTPTELYLTWCLADDARLFSPENMPAIILKTDDLDDLEAGICVFPSLDGKLVKVGESVGGSDTVTAPERIGRFVSPDRLRRLSAALAVHLPSLDPAPVRVTTYVDGFTPDHRPQLAASERVTAVAGFSGHGFKFATYVGGLAAQTALDGPVDGADLLFDINTSGSVPS
jgi:sarcosine oxidase